MSTTVPKRRHRRRTPLWRQVKDSGNVIGQAVELIGILSSSVSLAAEHIKLLMEANNKVVEALVHQDKRLAILEEKLKNVTEIPPLEPSSPISMGHLEEEGKERRILCKDCGFPTHFGACPFSNIQAGVRPLPLSRQTRDEYRKKTNIKENDRASTL